MNLESRFSFPLGHKVFLLNNLEAKSFLVLYEHGVENYDDFMAFLKSGRTSREFGFFAYDNSEGNLHPDRAFENDDGIQFFQLIRGTSKEIDDLDQELRKAYRKALQKFSAMRLVMDFGGLTSHEKEVIDITKRVYSKKDKSVRVGRKRKRFLLRTITAFKADALSKSTIKDLFSMNESIIFSGRGKYSITFADYWQNKINLSNVETIRKSNLEHFVKNHLKTLVLALLLREPMCGYDVIKTIHKEFQTFLSQGTVYPLLYSLRDEGILKVDDSTESRAKVYTLTENGRRMAESEIRNFATAWEYLLKSVVREGKI